MASIRYAANGKRDLHHLEEEYDSSFDKLQSNEKWKFDSNRNIVIDYLNACRKGLAKSSGINKRIGKSTLYRIMGILRLLSDKWIKKDFGKTTQTDWDKFYDNMEGDVFLNDHGTRYKAATKAKIYKTLRKFLKWKFGENKFYPAFCNNWVTKEDTVTKEYLTRAEADKMINATSTLKIKCLLMMLFDGGFRIEELANLRWCDVRKSEGKDYYKAHVKAETSKTKKERHVSLWLSTDYIDSYNNSEKNRLGKNFNETDFLFNTSYNKLYTTVHRIGKRVLNKSVSPHTMRHSSATYYASVIKTYQQFCARYGWTLRSSNPQRYFHRVEDDEIAQQTKDHEISRFKTEFERVRVENRQLREHMEKLETMFMKQISLMSPKEAKKKLTPELVQRFLEADNANSH